MTIKMMLDVDCDPKIKIFCGLFEDNAEEDSEESWYQDSNLLHSVDDWEEL